jgi:methylated-DNA-protein-cysteine methyltransferase related protein
MREQIIATIRRVPRGFVSTYGGIAKAAGYPGAARQVVRALHTGIDLPWQRIVGAGGHIKLRGHHAMDQRLRLEMEGVTFRGHRVNMRLHEYHFPRPAKKSRLKPKKSVRKAKKKSSRSIRK